MEAQGTQPSVAAHPGGAASRSLDGIKETSRSVWEKHAVFLSLAGATCLIAVISYTGHLSFGEALLASLIFTALWGAVFIVAPYILKMLIGLILGGIFIVSLIVLSQFLDGTAALIGAVVAVVLVILAFYGAVLVPGIFTGVATYELLGEGGGAFFAGFVVFIIVTAIVAFILKYVLPFIIGFVWGGFTGLLASKVAVMFAAGSSFLLEHEHHFRRGLSSLFKYLTAGLEPPPLLGIWIVILSVVFAARVAATVWKGEEEK